MMDNKPFIYQLRVRYQETDQMGVVYHANYLNWFEITRTEWIRHLGLSYASLEAQGLLLPVTDLQVKYIHPARYDDKIDIQLFITDFSYVRLVFEYKAYRESDGLLLVTGTTQHVWVNREWKPVRLDRVKPELYDILNKVT